MRDRGKARHHRRNAQRDVFHQLHRQHQICRDAPAIAHDSHVHQPELVRQLLERKPLRVEGHAPTQPQVARQPLESGEIVPISPQVEVQAGDALAQLADRPNDQVDAEPMNHGAVVNEIEPPVLVRWNRSTIVRPRLPE